MADTHTTIVRLLSNMASTREIQLYLKRFSQLEAARFAVVRVGGAVLRDELDALVSSLAFLQQVGLTPIVVHGAGPQLGEELAAAGIVMPLVDGRRFTSPEALGIVRRISQQANLRLVEALQAAGARATSIHTGVYEADFVARRRYGLLGRVVDVHTAAIDAAIDVRSIPVIAALGETTGGQILNVETAAAASALVLKLQPYKIIFLSSDVGLLDARGRRIESVSLTTQYDELIRQPWLEPAVREDLARIRDLLLRLPPSSSLSITRPDEMANELFTHRGSGTLIRRGEKIRRHASWKRVDLPRLRELIESSFGRPLAADYFESTRPFRVYCSEHYRAAIVLTRESGLVYMDKFTVSDEAQGEGLGRAIWQVMRAENPQLFWRSRRGNAINEFYFANADGAIRDDRWAVFWYGITDWKSIRAAVEHARARPASLLG
jgi:bifunctional N-acetylglutamate synthase/kinase